MGDSDGEAPTEVHHYNHISEVPWDIQKCDPRSLLPPSPAKLTGSPSYWRQRHNIFSKYDQGVWLTDDAWFGVTPEPVAT